MVQPVYKIFLWLYAVFYILAGCNHFISTEVYYGIFPEWLPAPGFLIYLSGLMEILLVIQKTRKFAAITIILMLIAFLPVHIDMILKAPFLLGKLMVTPFIAWLRIPAQFLLMYWAWYYYRKSQRQQNQV